MEVVSELRFPVNLYFFFFIITMFLQRKQVATPAFGGAQRAIEMCYRNLSHSEFSELVPGVVHFIIELKCFLCGNYKQVL